MFLLLFLLLNVSAESRLKPTQLPLALVGTIIRAEPAKSLATIQFTANKASDVFSQGKKVGELATIDHIQRDGVTIRTPKGDFEFIPLGSYDPGRAVKPAALDKDNGDREFHVKRDLVDKTIKELPTFLMQARAVPEMGPNNTIEGFRLIHIEPGSLYERLGLKPGDVLRSVNGVPLNSLQAGMAVYEQFRDSSLIQLRIDRGSRSVTATYLVR